MANIGGSQADFFRVIGLNSPMSVSVQVTEIEGKEGKEKEKGGEGKGDGKDEAAKKMERECA